MHLRERGRRNRLRLDDIETFLEVPAMLRDHRPDLIVGGDRGGDPVLEFLQFLDQLRGGRSSRRVLTI